MNVRSESSSIGQATGAARDPGAAEWRKQLAFAERALRSPDTGAEPSLFGGYVELGWFLVFADGATRSGCMADPGV